MAVKFQKKSVKDTSVVQVREDIVLTTELTAESGSVKWYKDGVELKEGVRCQMKKDGLLRTLIVKSSEAKDSGTYTCQTSDDKLEFKIQVKGGSLYQQQLLHMPYFLLIMYFNFRGSFEVCRPFKIHFSRFGRYPEPCL